MDLAYLCYIPGLIIVFLEMRLTSMLSEPYAVEVKWQ